MSVMDGAGTPSGFPAGDWSVDAGRSSVAFALRHMTLATVKGRFRQFEGTIQTGPGPGTPRATGAVRADTIDTGDPTRDEQLRRSADFFDVERYPEISFSSSRIEYVDHRRLRVVGGLTMRGITHEIEPRRAARRDRPASGRQVADRARLARGPSRKDFGLTWNQALDAGGALLGNKVKIALELSPREARLLERAGSPWARRVHRRRPVAAAQRAARAPGHRETATRGSAARSRGALGPARACSLDGAAL